MATRRRAASLALICALAFVSEAFATPVSTVGLRSTILVLRVSCPPSGPCAAVGIGTGRRLAIVQIARSGGAMHVRLGQVVAARTGNGGQFGRTGLLDAYANTGNPSAIACATAQTCVAAVPASDNVASRTLLFVTHNGHPGIAIQTGISIRAISCGAPHRVLGVRTEHPRTPWTDRRDPERPIAKVFSPGHVGAFAEAWCWSATSCTAVAGPRALPNGVDVVRQSTKIMTVVNGVPGPQTAVGIQYVSGLACYVAGDYGNGQGIQFGGLVQAISNGIPRPTISVPSTNFTTALACRATNECFVFGNKYGSASNQTVMISFNGRATGPITQFSPRTLPMNDATCSASGCMAVGGYYFAQSAQARVGSFGQIYRFG
jgi:hypothetical protein